MVQDSVPQPNAQIGSFFDLFWLPGLSRVPSIPINVSKKIRNPGRKSKRKPETALSSLVQYERTTNEPFAVESCCIRTGP